MGSSNCLCQGSKSKNCGLCNVTPQSWMVHIHQRCNSKKNMDRIFINPRTTRVPIIKVIKYQHGAASDSVSFINNHLQSTKKLSVGSIQEIIQGRRPESLNLQILGASKHQTEENKYRLKMTDGRDLIDEAVLDSSEMSPPNKR